MTRKKETKLTFVERLLFGLVIVSLLYTLAVDFQGEHNNDLILGLDSRVSQIESEEPCDSHSYFYKSHTSHESASALMDIPGNDTELADRLADNNPYSGLELVYTCL